MRKHSGPLQPPPTSRVDDPRLPISEQSTQAATVSAFPINRRRFGRPFAIMYRACRRVQLTDAACGLAGDHAEPQAAVESLAVQPWRCTLKRTLALILCVLAIGCRLPEEREGLRPLPRREAFSRIKTCTNAPRSRPDAAQDAFYTDNWLELDNWPRCWSRPPAFSRVQRPAGQDQEDHGQGGRVLCVSRRCVCATRPRSRTSRTLTETTERIHLTITQSQRTNR